VTSDRLALTSPEEEPEVEFAEGEPTPEERERFEAELVEIVADVIVARRSIAA
jgi:hypothetical protein